MAISIRPSATARAGVAGLLLGTVLLPAGLPAEQAHDPLPPPLMAPQAEIEPPPQGFVFAPATTITFEERVLELVNQARLDNGALPPLKGASELDDASETHSFNMADRNFFAHCDVDTKQSPFDRMLAAGYVFNAAAENIAAGQPTPEAVMFGSSGWMNSPGHRANILSTAYREIGNGYFQEPGDQPNIRLDQNGDCNADASGFGPAFHYWTQNFGRRNGVYPVVINRESHDTACAELRLYVYGPSNASEMRFSNDGATWSAWQPYSPTATWTIPGSSGSPATVFSQVRAGASVFSADDSIFLDSGFPAPSTLDLDAPTVNSTEIYIACGTISAGDAFGVGPTGDVTFRAGSRVVLRGGFTVAAGGAFRAIIDSTL